MGDALFVAAWLAAAGGAAAHPPNHDHDHPHNRPHQRSDDSSRFVTNRASDITLDLPAEENSFIFAVFGDRTGGPADGVKVLAEAVRDTNLIEPDLVMTVGDLIEGYNQRDQWMAQMREYREIMDRLLCPWFPVAGNHDVYWRGPNRPPQEHEGDYEMHFGPLWYAFEHKDCWFIVLYSDEANPETGERNFNKTECQVMSEAQFSWLKETLEKARSARHVFVFLHHPRLAGAQLRRRLGEGAPRPRRCGQCDRGLCRAHSPDALRRAPRRDRICHARDGRRGAVAPRPRSGISPSLSPDHRAR